MAEEKKEAPKPVKMVTFYSIFPFYRIAVQTEKYHQREGEDGKMVKVQTRQEKQLAFVNHRATTNEEIAADLKQRGQNYQYGTSFITAEDLKEMLLSPETRAQGESFIYQMYRRDVMSNQDEKTRDVDIYMELGITPDMYRGKKKAGAAAI